MDTAGDVVSARRVCVLARERGIDGKCIVEDDGRVDGASCFQTLLQREREQLEKVIRNTRDKRDKSSASDPGRPPGDWIGEGPRVGCTGLVVWQRFKLLCLLGICGQGRHTLSRKNHPNAADLVSVYSATPARPSAALASES